MNVNQEPKYKIENGKLVNRQSGEAIPDDEPVFILRGRDELAAQAILQYWRNVGDNTHARAVMLRHDQFKAWARNHPERMKSPDTVLTPEWETLIA